MKDIVKMKGIMMQNGVIKMKTPKLKVEVQKAELKPRPALPGRGSLRPLTFNAKKWRKENGYTTPEWEMYVKNVVYTTTILCMVSFVLGWIYGKII